MKFGDFRGMIWPKERFHWRGETTVSFDSVEEAWETNSLWLRRDDAQFDSLVCVDFPLNTVLVVCETEL